MTDKKTSVGDEMITARLENYSKKLNISLDSLIERYIRRGLFTDDYYEPPQRTREELIEMGRKAVEKDIENGFPPVKHNFDVFVGRWARDDD